MRDWGEAVNARDWARACGLSEDDSQDCETELREDFGRATLTFEGPATGGGTGPGEAYFAFGGDAGSVFVTAVPDGDGYRVRVEAVVE